MERGTLPVSGKAPAATPGPGTRNVEAGRPKPSAEHRTRVLLADDHPVVRQGLIACLQTKKNLEVVGQAADGQEALKRAKELQPDVILMDIDMPRMNGLAVTEVLRKELPKVKVLILSMDSRPEYMLRIIQSGARGHVLKDASTDELVNAIETVGTGQPWFGPGFARLALEQMTGGAEKPADSAQLTKREREVLIDVAKGFSNKEIGCRLNIGTRTVETHRENLMAKLNIRSVAGLTKFAFANGLVTMREGGRS